MPTSKKSKSKSKTKSKLVDSGISRLDKLPTEIRSQIYNNNYFEIFPFFLKHLQTKLENLKLRVNYRYLHYDHKKIIQKLKIKNSDIKNFNNINDERNFKDFNKKIHDFINNYITPLVIEYGQIRDIIEPLSVNEERNHDFEYLNNIINIVEFRLKTHIKKFNKLLYILRSKYNSDFNLDELDFINNAINSLNKVTKKLLPTIKTQKSLIKNRYTRSLTHSKKSKNTLNLRNYLDDYYGDNKNTKKTRKTRKTRSM